MKNDNSMDIVLSGGWIEWKGGDQPVQDDTVVDVMIRSGETGTGLASIWDWTHNDGAPWAGDIIAYRVHNDRCVQKNSQFIGDQCGFLADQCQELIESGCLSIATDDQKEAWLVENTNDATIHFDPVNPF